MKLDRSFLVVLILPLILPLSVSAADLGVVVDGQELSGVESVVYDAGTARLSVQLADGPPCQGQVIAPSAGQLGLAVFSDVHAIAGPVVYSVNAQRGSLGISTQLGKLSCAPDQVFVDGFEAPG